MIYQCTYPVQRCLYILWNVWTLNISCTNPWYTGLNIACTCLYYSKRVYKCIYMYIHVWTMYIHVITLNVHTMYVSCTDAYIHLQKCVNMYIHVNTFREMYIQCMSADVLSHCIYTVHTWYKHVCTSLCQVVRIPDTSMPVERNRVIDSTDKSVEA